MRQILNVEVNKNYEIIIIENNSEEKTTFAYYKDIMNQNF